MYSKMVGSELCAIRNRLGLSLKNVEKITGIYAQTLSDYENNKVNIKVTTLEKILLAYKLDLFIFFKSIYENTHINKGQETKHNEQE